MRNTAVPFANAYWVRPGQLLAGEYPSAPHADVARRRVDALIGAGITYVMDLTTDDDPLDAYDDLLRERAAALGSSVVYSPRPIRDLDCPSAGEMRAILDEIDAAIEQGHVVYVHCWGGVGRTGTVVGCHLVRRGHTGAAALDEVARLFGTMSPVKLSEHPRSPETQAQRAFVRGWAEQSPPGT